MMWNAGLVFMICLVANFSILMGMLYGIVPFLAAGWWLVFFAVTCHRALKGPRVEKIVAEYRLGICLDVGHILLCVFGLAAHLERYLERTRVVHLHGIVEGKDHRDISHLDAALLDMLLGRLLSASMPRVMTLEVFSERELGTSIEVMRRYTGKLSAGNHPTGAAG